MVRVNIITAAVYATPLYKHPGAIQVVKKVFNTFHRVTPPTVAASVLSPSHNTPVGGVASCLHRLQAHGFKELKKEYRLGQRLQGCQLGLLARLHIHPVSGPIAG